MGWVSLLLHRLLFLLLEGNQHDNQGASHQGDTNDTVHPGAVVTSLRQVEALGIDNGQRSQCVGGLAVIFHVHIVAVHLGIGGQEVVFQVVLGNTGQVQVGTAVSIGDGQRASIAEAVVGVVLEDTQHILV